MGLFNRKPKEEQRTLVSVPFNVGGPAHPSRVTTENATSLVPVFASMRILADNIASLPIDAYRKQQGDLTPQQFVPPLFFSPSARDNRFQWVHKCVVSLVLRGNAYGLVTARDQLGFPTQVEWLHPDDVVVDETSPVDPKFYYLGRPVDSTDIVHIPWIVQPGRAVGMSPVAAFASTMGVGLAATNYGKQWFDTGGAPPSMLKNNAKSLNEDEAKLVQKGVSKSIASGKPLVLGSDWDFTSLSLSSDEAQFLQTIKANATQIAAIYGVPATMVGGEPGGSMTYSNVEMEVNNLIVLSLRPWIVRLETAFSGLLANAEEVRFNVDSMIRMSVKDRYEAYGLALTQGWMNLDMVRAKENLPPLPNGEGKGYGTPKPPVAPPPPAQDTAPQEGVTQ